MKYEVQMRSGAIIYIPSIIKTGPGIQKLIWWYSQTKTAWGLHKPTFILFSK
jgi:hypothetical protein